MNLNDNQAVSYICQILQEKEAFSHLDISWSKMTPKQLVQISKALIEEDGFAIRNLKSLNLAYNSLYFDENNAELLNSEDFVDNLEEFIKESFILNHLNISGMNLGNQQILQLAKVIS